MKIAHLVSTFPPYTGGMGNVAYHQALELSKLGHQVEVFTLTNKSKFEQFKVNQLKPWLKYGNAGLIPQIFWKLKKFDIVHLHYPFFGGAEIVYFWKLFNRKKKLILTYHMDVVGQGALRYFFKFHNRFILPGIIKRADQVLVSSTDYLNNSNIKANYNKNHEKFTEIPLGVSESFQPEAKDEELLEEYNLSHDDIILLFVGGLDKAHYFKGVELLIKTFAGLSKKINNLKLLIVGGGGMKPDYQRLTTSLNIADRVVFTGRVSDELLPKVYNLSDIFVLPSTDRSEAFGLVILEAMACGKPVVASRLPGVRQVV
ncbi:MAG TPA: glycosyltransferase family 4 protein, partial [Patescibacteria group bacterium]